MRRHSLPIGILAISFGLLAGATTARAGPQTWVSPSGSDAGTCPVTAPCKTFQFAYGQTSANGVISVLAAGQFGPLTIAKSISVVADGVEALIFTGAGGAAIIVNGSGIVVSLRGLTIDMRGTANNGISFVSGAALHVHNSVLRKSANGISFAPASGTSELYVSDSVIADTSQTGIDVRPTGSGGAKVVLDRVRVENAIVAGILFSGISTTGSITATVRDSVSAGNDNSGIVALEGGGSGTTNVMVDRTASVDNSFAGIFAQGAGATIRIGDSTVSGNGTGLLKNDGVIASYKTNKVNRNGTDGVPTNTIDYK